MKTTIEELKSQANAVNSRLANGNHVEVTGRYNRTYIDMYDKEGNFLKSIANGTKSEVSTALDIMFTTSFYTC